MGSGRIARLGLVALGVARATPAVATPSAAIEVPRAAAHDTGPRQLDAPGWITQPIALATLTGEPAAATIAWTAVPGAARYRVTWADRSGKTDVETKDTHLVHDVGPGDYTLTVVAIDRSGRDGASSPPLPVVITEVRATPPGAADPAPPKTGAYAIGTRFDNCTLPGASAHVASTAGSVRLACGGPAVSVVIAPVTVATSAPALPRAHTTVVHVAVASVAELGEQLDVVAAGDIALGPVRRTAFGIDVPVEVEPGARTAALEVDGSGIALGRVELALADAGAPSALPSVPAWFALDAGGQIGSLWLPSEGPNATRLGHPTADGDVATSGGLVGARLGIFPIRRVGLEAEGSFVSGGYADSMGVAKLVELRGQLAARVYDRDRFGIRVVVGAGVLDVAASHGTSRGGASGEVHGGVATTLETRRDLWVRLQLVDAVTTARDGGYAHCPELQLGVVTRLGRRDRW